MRLTLAFLSSRFPTGPNKSKEKFKYFPHEKSLLGERKGHFSSFLKGSQLPEILFDLKVWLKVFFRK